MFALRNSFVKFAGKNVQARKFSIGTTLQNGIWRKSTMNYITYVGVACIVAEIIYGTTTNSVWDLANRGVSIIIKYYLFKLFNYLDV